MQIYFMSILNTYSFLKKTITKKPLFAMYLEFRKNCQLWDGIHAILSSFFSALWKFLTKINLYTWDFRGLFEGQFFHQYPVQIPLGAQLCLGTQTHYEAPDDLKVKTWQTQWFALGKWDSFLDNGPKVFVWQPNSRYKKCKWINLFHVTGLFLYPLKTSENLWFSNDGKLTFNSFMTEVPII